MAECSRGSVVARPASGFFDRDKLIMPPRPIALHTESSTNLTSSLDRRVPVEAERLSQLAKGNLAFPGRRVR
jgi:hypothetical protein